MAKTQDPEQAQNAGWKILAGKEEEKRPWDEQAKRSLLDEVDQSFRYGWGAEQLLSAAGSVEGGGVPFLFVYWVRGRCFLGWSEKW